MNLLVIGDVHGCYHTLVKLLDENWNPKNELLIQVGDLVNKGPNSAQCIRYWMELEGKHPEKVILLKGNHELKFIEGLRKKGELEGEENLKQNIKKEGLKRKQVRQWLKELPLKWENDHILITHAGIGKKVEDPYREEGVEGVLHNKGPLKCLDKLQVKGHSIVEGHKPVFNPSENTWYIDTGAWTKKYLSALRLSPEGKLLKVVNAPTQPADIEGGN